MKSNEFAGATLGEAVRNATAAYRDAPGERKNFCSGLRSQYDRKRSDLDRIQQDVGDLKDKIDDLQRDAARANFIALALSAGTAARAATKWRGILNLLRRFKLDRDALDAILRNGPDASAAATAVLSALFAIQDNDEAEKLSREVSRLQARSDRIIEQMEDLAQSFLNGNCHLQSVQS